LPAEQKGKGARVVKEPSEAKPTSCPEQKGEKPKRSYLVEKEIGGSKGRGIKGGGEKTSKIILGLKGATKNEEKDPPSPCCPLRRDQREESYKRAESVKLWGGMVETLE